MFQSKGVLRLTSFFFVFTVLVHVPFLLRAQKHLNFKRITINEGLSQNTVFCIIQDNTGFIWIGTEDGLNKYDGYEFTVYKHENHNQKSLTHSQVNAIVEDERGNFWVGTSDGLNLFNKHTETFSRIQSKNADENGSSNFITSLYYDSHQNLWVGTYDGLKYYDYQVQKLIDYDIGSKGNGGDISNRVQTIFEDKDKTIWVSVGKDLKRIDIRTRKPIMLPDELATNKTLKASNIRTISQSNNGDLWFGTEETGLYRHNLFTKKTTRYAHHVNNANSLPVDIIRTMLPFGDNELWVGTRDGLSLLNTETDQINNYKYSAYDSKSLSHNSIRSILKDKAGNIWIGTYAGGLNFFSAAGNNFAYIGQKTSNKIGLTHHVVSSILVDQDLIWIGTEGGGLNYLNRSSAVTGSYIVNSIQQNIVKSLAKDQEGNLWIGTYDGVSHLNTRTQKITNYEITADDGKPENKQVYAIAVSDDGIWLGTDGRGLKFMDKSRHKITSYFHDRDDKNSISGNIVLSLLKHGQNNLWVGTEHGLNYFDIKSKKFTQYIYNPDDPYSIQHNTIISLFYDSKGRLWIGTEGGGLNFFDESTNRFYAIDIHLGLASSVIHAIREDRAGNLWVSTNKGLSKIQIKKLTLPFERQFLQILNYTVEDGLQSNQFTSGAVEMGEDGELFFGGINGLTSFFPDKITYNAFKPKVVITDFLIKNDPVKIGSGSPLKKTINETDTIVLSHDQAFITFKFAALNYVNPEKNQYEYKLKGFYDDDWHFVGNQRQATYTNLDAGSYTFQVRASNNDGLWADDIKSIRIIVLPPWWKTWWAYTLYAVAIALLLYLFYYHSVKTARLTHELNLQHMSHEKDQELAQRKLSFFTNISHEIKTPLTLILSPIDKLIDQNEGNNKILNQLRLIQRNGERLVRLTNQLLDFRNFEEGGMTLQAAEGNIVRFVREIMLAFEPYAEHRRIQLKVKSEQNSIRLWFDRDKLEKVMYNLLSNALKFTNEGGEVTISIQHNEETNDTVLLSVKDNGIGIPIDQIDKIFEKFSYFDNNGFNATGTGIGLAFSKGLVELHKGTIWVESREATPSLEGETVFTISLPLGSKHLAPNEIIADYKDSENILRYRQTEMLAASKSAMEKRKQQVISNVGKEKLIMLVVEDNEEVRKFVAEHFEDDFDIEMAENGEVGLEKAYQIIPDIIISDVMMPLMDGIALCRALKTDARTSHIPVVLLTARTHLIFNIEGLETGADDYITKPFNLSILETRIWNLIDNRQKLRERYSKEITLQPKNVAITSPDEKFLEKIMNFIEKNMAEPELSVEELANIAGMSRVTLYRKIKALTNQTAIEFIRSVRLKRAAQLLVQNKLNVNEVAYMVGFLDIDYFRRCFKEEFGATPKEFAGNAAKE